jgi:hypothetical protein
VASIETGGAPGGSGFVKIDAVGVAYQTAGKTTGPVRFALRVTRDAGGATPGNYATLVPTPTGTPNPNVTSALTWVVPVPNRSSETFRLKGIRDWGTGELLAKGQISLTYIPFGATGSGPVESAAARTAEASTGENQP